jgi:hypothetical protein
MADLLIDFTATTIFCCLKRNLLECELQKSAAEDAAILKQK